MRLTYKPILEIMDCFFLTNNFDVLFIKNSSVVPLIYSYWLEQYNFLLVHLFISIIITCVLFIVAFILSPKQLTFEKLSSYECGFEPFKTAHSVFNIQFFVVGILFLIFDLELAYLFPWVLFLGNLTIFSIILMLFFILLLIIGFVYEWKKGALDWL